MRAMRLAAWVTLAAFPLAAQEETSSRLLPIEHDGKVGFIDTAGRLVIPPQFDVASVCVPGMVLVQRAGTWGFIDTAGRTVIPLQFDDARCFAAGLAGVRVGAKWGFIDRTGRTVIEPGFDEAGWFSEGLAAARIGDRWGFIDTTGAMLIQPEFGQAFIARFSGGRAWVGLVAGGDALIDRTGRVVSGPFEYMSQFANGLAGVRDRNGDFSFVDSTGRAVIRPRPGATRWDVALRFDGGRAPVKIGEKWGYIDTTGALVIEPRFEYASEFFTDGRASVVIGRRWGYVDTTGAVVIGPQFDYAHPFSEGMAVIQVDGNWGYIDTAGRIVVRPQFFLDMGRGVRHGHVPSAKSFSEGLAAVRTGLKWGYIDPTGELVIAPQYDDAEAFDGGLARVTIGTGQQGRVTTYVNRAGRLLWDPRQPGVAAQAAPLDTSLLAGSGSLVDRVAVMVERLEAAEAGAVRLDLPPEQLTPQLDHAATQLGRHLDANPDDVRALILSARLGRLRDVRQPTVWSAGDPPPSLATFARGYAPHHAALDRALALQPDNAEAHYWKGRLYGLGFTWQQTLYGMNEPPDSEVLRFQAYGDSAVRFGRRAADLAPTRDDYRDALAIYLVLSWEDNAAITLLQHVAGGRHPLYLLLSDWRALPLPAGAVLRRADSRAFGQMAGASLGVQDYAFLRVRVHVVALPKDSVEAFYRARWPGFRFHELENEDSDNPGLRSYAQFVRWRDGRAVVARNTGEIPDQPTEGIAVGLIEITSPTPEARERYGIPVAPVFSVLTLINARRFDGR